MVCFSGFPKLLSRGVRVMVAATAALVSYPFRNICILWHNYGPSPFSLTDPFTLIEFQGSSIDVSELH